jgi:hypothetical protein
MVYLKVISLHSPEETKQTYEIRSSGKLVLNSDDKVQTRIDVLCNELQKYY